MAQLKRRLGFWLLTSYGVGTTLGAGIYVLVGEVAGIAGYYAPLSFLLAGLLALPSGLSFAELSARYPKSAGEAVYVQAAFQTHALAFTIGVLVIFSGIISAATLLNGFTGYLSSIWSVPPWSAILSALGVLCLIAIWGIKESIALAAVITFIEATVLLFIAAIGTTVVEGPSITANLSSSAFAPIGLLSGGLIAFYAFIGFEDMVNVAEEVIDVQHIMPRAILATLGITCTIYVIVSFIATYSVGPQILASQAAPLAYVFSKASGLNAAPISLIAIFAIVNGALIQMIMASRVLYGMARQKWLPEWVGAIHKTTRTPITATLCVTAVIALFALALPLVKLAELTSTLILTIFTLVNLALWRIKQSNRDYTGFTVPKWAPISGAIASASFILIQFF